MQTLRWVNMAALPPKAPRIDVGQIRKAEAG
jgi:hypothetical protein